jgi:hydroxyacylglutathione hydrolase
MTIEVITVPALRDNYAYLIVDRATAEAVVIDPSESEPVLAALAREGVAPRAIWCTHHHPDHVAGVPGLLARTPEIPVIGSAYDLRERRIEGQTAGVGDGDEVAHGGETFAVVEIPGHTLGAIAFVGAGVAFTGDTLFLAGCGRVFEGTMPMMRASLDRLARLPRETKIYCGHEYTEKNLEFASVIEPLEVAITTRLASVRAARRDGRPTVPGTLGEELATNPFLRADSSAVRAYAASRGPATSTDEIFARIREAKDSF